jgi:hypothetical protein
MLWKYFKGSLIITVLGLMLGAFIGYQGTGTVFGAAEALFIVAVLGILEVSLSFDNAVVNATVLRDMDEIWRRRFITWGIAIAVFGMRIVFPLVIVAVVGHLSPWEAARVAVSDPVRYAEIITSAHISVSAFGGAFLAMVGISHFLDEDKDIHWIEVLERPLTRLGRIKAVELGLVLGLLYAVSTQLGAAEQLEFLIAGIMGLLTYIGVDGIGALLGEPSGAIEGAPEPASAPSGEHPAVAVVKREGLAAFLYLEVLDASFSFDGVIGAFALTTNLFIIAIGLGVGAMFVRSLTILLLEKGTLTEYRYLEHGAFYAIIALGVIMFVQSFVHIPEWITGLIGAGFIGLAFISSIRYNRKQLAEPQG